MSAYQRYLVTFHVDETHCAVLVDAADESDAVDAAILAADRAGYDATRISESECTVFYAIINQVFEI